MVDDQLVSIGNKRFVSGVERRGQIVMTYGVSLFYRQSYVVREVICTPKLQ